MFGRKLFRFDRELRLRLNRLNEFHYLYNDNMLLVAGAGNHGGRTSNYDTLAYPASYEAVISVAALDSHARRWDGLKE